MANMITKRYKIAAHYEFLTIRKGIWLVQFAFLILALCIGFPTTVIQRHREFVTNPRRGAGEPDPAHVAGLEDILYWVYLSGIFKDHRKDVANYFYVPMLSLLAALMLERVAINWLSNRNGCTYNKL